MLNVILMSVEEESVTVLRDDRLVKIPLIDIEKVSLIRSGKMVQGAIVGAGVGLIVGGVAGFAGAPPDDRKPRTITTAVAAGVIGGIVGSVIGSMPEKADLLDFRNSTTLERKNVLSSLLMVTN